MHYYETYEYHNSGERPESHGCDLIAEIGGSWTEFKKCWFCDKWVDITTMNKNDLCDHCESYLISRGEI